MKKEKQRSLFDELNEIEAEEETVAGELKPQAGETVLDRVHQAMLSIRLRPRRSPPPLPRR